MPIRRGTGHPSALALLPSWNSSSGNGNLCLPHYVQPVSSIVLEHDCWGFQLLLEVLLPFLSCVCSSGGGVAVRLSPVWVVTGTTASTLGFSCAVSSSVICRSSRSLWASHFLPTPLPRVDPAGPFSREVRYIVLVASLIQLRSPQALRLVMLSLLSGSELSPLALQSALPQHQQFCLPSPSLAQLLQQAPRVW